MTPTYGPKAVLRDKLTTAADAIAPLNVPGCTLLAEKFRALSSRPLRDSELSPVLALGRTVRDRLLADASPDRWLDQVSGMAEFVHDEMDLVGELVEERTAQARTVRDALDALESAVARTPVPVG